MPASDRMGGVSIAPLRFGGEIISVEGDLPDMLVRSALDSKYVSIDLETSGLDFKLDTIGSIQLCVSQNEVCVVRPPYGSLENIRWLLACEKVTKIFHHAMFDLRFLAYKFHIEVQDVACTKVAAKVLRPGDKDTSLKKLTREYLGVELDKSERLSDWMSFSLSASQLAYAAGDVIYLEALLRQLMNEAREKSVEELIKKSFRYLPTRVDLDIRGTGDVFVY